MRVLADTAVDVAEADWRHGDCHRGVADRSAQDHCGCGLRGPPEPRLQGLAMNAAAVQIQSSRLKTLAICEGSYRWARDQGQSPPLTSRTAALLHLQLCI